MATMSAVLLASVLLIPSMDGGDIGGMTAALRIETGMAFLQQGLLEQAEQEFERALEVGSGDEVAVLGLGMVSMAEGALGRAEGYLRDYISLCPDDYRGYETLSELFTRAGMPDSALAYADSAFLRAPTSHEVWLLCAETSLAAGDTTGSEMWLTRAISAGDATSLEAAALLGAVYRATERSVESRELLLPYASAGYAPAWWGLARVYLAWGDWMRAVDAIGQYLQLAPGGTYADSAVMVLEDLAESGDYIPPD